jgi:hypothetical protein
MFYCTQNQQYINEGTAFEINGVQYPANWLNLSTPEEKAEVGLEEVIATNQPANQTYYWVSETLTGAELTYTNTPKDLLTVKTTALNQINATAYSILLPTDWMVVKSVETSTPINPSWNAWRQSIRTTALNATNGVESAADVDAVASVMGAIVWPKDPDQVAYEAAQVVEEPVAEPTIEPTVEPVVEPVVDPAV